MPDARDAEDTRLLDANDFSRLLATYYRVVLERCRLKLADWDASEVAHNVMERLLCRACEQRPPCPASGLTWRARGNLRSSFE